jgi:hypothetical protein
VGNSNVQRFLDRAGSAAGKLRSREAAAPILVRALSKLTREELLRLVRNNESPGESDFSLLAREIMKKPGKEPGNVSERAEKPAKS